MQDIRVDAATPLAGPGHGQIAVRVGRLLGVLNDRDASVVPGRLAPGRRHSQTRPSGRWIHRSLGAGPSLPRRPARAGDAVGFRLPQGEPPRGRRRPRRDGRSHGAQRSACRAMKVRAPPRRRAGCLRAHRPAQPTAVSKARYPREADVTNRRTFPSTVARLAVTAALLMLAATPPAPLTAQSRTVLAAQSVGAVRAEPVAVVHRGSAPAPAACRCPLARSPTTANRS